MNNIENAANIIFPIAAKLSVIAGLITILLGITIAVYKRLQMGSVLPSVRRETLWSIRLNFIASLAGGAALYLAGFLISFLKDFDMDTSGSGFFITVLIGYAVSLAGYAVLKNIIAFRAD